MRKRWYVVCEKGCQVGISREYKTLDEAHKAALFAVSSADYERATVCESVGEIVAERVIREEAHK